MRKLIELDAALDALREVIVPEKDIGFGDELTDGYNDGINMAVTVVSALPTVDAVPVRHGRWKHKKDLKQFFCDQCGEPSLTEDDVYFYGMEFPNFCPNCGADMRKDGDYGKAD